MNEIRIVIADDSELMLYMIRELLNPDYDVVASVADYRAAVEATARLNPTLVLLDNFHAHCEWIRSRTPYQTTSPVDPDHIRL